MLLSIAVTGDEVMRSLAAARLADLGQLDLLEQECQLFSQFKSAGFHDQEASRAKAVLFLADTFGAHTAPELASAIATAATRENSPRHLLALEAVNQKLVDPASAVGKSTVDREVKEFRYAVGF